MTVPAVPFWLSAANTEFAGSGWASNIMSKAGLAVPGWTSSLAGKSAATVYTVNVATWEPAQGDVECGFYIGQGGSVSPANFKGVRFRGMYAANYDDYVHLVFDGPTPATTLTIAGAGTVAVPANNSSAPFNIPWGELYGWLWARVGQNISVTLTG